MILERLVGLAVAVASGACLIVIKMLELPGVLTIPLVVGAVMLCMGGIVVLFAEEPMVFLHVRARKALKDAKVIEATMSYRNPDSIRVK